MLLVSTLGLVGIVIGCVLGGGVVGFIICKKMVTKQMQDNPPINEAMIRAMFRQMGRNPSEKQVREIMRSMNNAK